MGTVLIGMVLVFVSVPPLHLDAAEQAPTLQRVPAAIAAERLLEKVEPQQSPLIKLAGFGGVVKLSILIDEKGKVQNVRVVSGHPLLAATAVEAVKKWRYRPFEENGRTQAVETEVEITFAPTMSKPQMEANQRYFEHERAGRDAYNRRDYAAAEKHFLEAQRYAEQLPPERYLERTIALKYLGYIHLNQKLYDKAEPFLKRQVEILEQHQKADGVELGSAFRDLALLYQGRGDYEKAEQLYLRAISIFEARVEESRVNQREPFRDYVRQLVGALNHLGVVYLNTARAQEAESLFQRAASLSEQRIDNHDLLLISLQNRAVALRRLGRAEEAKELEERANSLRRQEKP